MYCSIDGGSNWEPLQLNLPHTPITDMEIKNDMLVMSTQGRGFWTLDDISPLREAKDFNEGESIYLYDIPSTYLSNLGRTSGPFSPQGSSFQPKWMVWSSDSTEAEVIITDAKKDTIITLKDQKLKKGMNKMSWNLRHDPPALVKDLVMMDMRYPGQGPKVPPGTYEVNIQVGEKVYSDSFDLILDPAWETPGEDFSELYELSRDVAEIIEESQQRIMHLRKVTTVTNTLRQRESMESYKTEMDSIVQTSKKLQDMIYQDKILSSQDEINYERKLTNHLIRLYRVFRSSTYT